MDQGSGFRVQGSGLRVQGSRFRAWGLRFRVQGSGFRVQGSRFGFDGLGLRVQGSEFELLRFRGWGRFGIHLRLKPHRLHHLLLRRGTKGQRAEGQIDGQH